MQSAEVVDCEKLTVGGLDCLRRSTPKVGILAPTSCKCDFTVCGKMLGLLGWLSQTEHDRATIGRHRLLHDCLPRRENEIFSDIRTKHRQNRK